MGAFFGFAQFPAGATGYDIHTVLNEIADEALEVQEHRATFDEGYVVDRETGLQVGEFVEFIENDLCVGIFLEFDHDTDIAFGLVADIADAFYFLFADEVGYFLYEFALDHAVGQFGDDYMFASVVFCFDVGVGADDDASSTCLKGIAHALVAIDRTACREVGGFDVLHQFRHSYFLGDFLTVGFGFIDGYLSFDVSHAAVNDFAEVVGRHISSHTDGDTGSTVD